MRRERHRPADKDEILILRPSYFGAGVDGCVEAAPVEVESTVIDT
jgi:hypothetical protein